VPEPVIAKVFYTPSCKRCEPIFSQLTEAKMRLNGKVEFQMFDIADPAAHEIGQGYGVTRIPSIVCFSEIFFVGIPTVDDLVRMLDYLFTNEGRAKDFM
jgi:thiol-disulfide isomerase/thioredoxin